MGAHPSRIALASLWCAAMLAACPATDDTPTPPSTAAPLTQDADGDSYSPAQGDCDDRDPTVHPSAPEVCNGRDDDCDQAVDGADPDLIGGQPLYIDADGDGFGDIAAGGAACPAEGLSGIPGDCDDADPAVHPDADERCNGMDDDCDRAADEDPALGASLWYADEDGDGYGAPGDGILACDPPASGMAPSSGDCDDQDPTTHPHTDERCDASDHDCDGDPTSPLPADAPTWYPDQDGDGYGQDEGATRACEAPWPGAASQGGDCDDADPSVHPDDQGGCGQLPEETPCPDGGGEPVPWYPDADGDGYGAGDGTLLACAAPPGRASSGGDCEDGDPAVHPGAAERCDGEDNDCDEAIDEGVDEDADGDGFDACADCDDGDPLIYPGGPLSDDRCDGRDEDCDGQVDEDYDPGGETCTCNGATRFLTCDGGAVSCPADVQATHEARDDIDNDCDGQIDEDYDQDGDGYYSSASPRGEPVDCDDGDACDPQGEGYQACLALAGEYHPSAAEACDGRDQDCDGEVDEDYDRDGDGALDAALCPQGDDCDDGDPALHPQTTWYADRDHDGWGAGAPRGAQGCEPPGSGLAPNAADCDDTDPAIHPGADERPGDEIDGDCDGAEICFEDGDGDGYHTGIPIASGDPLCDAPGEAPAAMGGDCDDADPGRSPGAIDVPDDGRDQDCDGADALPTDLNRDGFPDLIQVNSGSPGNPAVNSYVFLGGPEGVDPASRIELPTLGAQQACVADFDEDGWLDIAFANHQDASGTAVNSYIYWGSEAGFDEGDLTELATVGATGCATGDVNGDGLVDLAFANHTDGSTFEVQSYVFINNPEEGFSRAGRLELSTQGAAGVIAADLDDDGKDDLVFACERDNRGHAVDSYVYWGGAEGPSDDHRVPIPTVGATRPAAAYVDGGSSLDLLFNSAFDGSRYALDSYVYFGPGFAVESRLALPGNGARAMAVADFDGDGHQDIVVSGSFDGDHQTDGYIYYGSDRGWSDGNRDALPMSGAQALAVHDLDLDGSPDLAVANLSDGDYAASSMIFWGHPAGLDPSRADPLPTLGASALAAGDLDLDGYPELAFASLSDGDRDTRSRVYPGSRRGPAEGARTSIPTFGARQALVADLNGDGYLEIVIPNQFDGATHQLPSLLLWGSAKGAGRGEVTELPTLGAYAACTGDLNGDGRPDLVFANYQNDSLYAVDSYIYWGGAEGYSEHRRDGLPTNGASDCEVADVDGDGDEDLLFANSWDGRCDLDSFVYLNDGGATPAFEQITLPTHCASAVTARDLNGDGLMEILFSNYRDDAANYAVGSYLYWAARAEGAEDETPGAQAAPPTWPIELRQTLRSQAPVSEALVADVVGDDHLDILFPSNSGDGGTRSTLYQGSAAGYAEDASRDFNIPNTWSAQAADFDGDGNQDLLFVTNRGGGSNASSVIYYGQGGEDGGFAEGDRTLLPGRATRAAIADLNRDGELDIAFAGANDQDPSVPSYIYWGDAVGFVEAHRTALTNASANDVQAADLDGDGQLDLVFAAHYDGDYATESHVFWGSEDCDRELPWERCFANERVQELPAVGAVDIVMVGTVD